ncbi:transmembrane protein, putative [Medicago truncatula]|uniref:Transmembrane protein, putative n=1 Tax=Medicago truncatula TaxID=3880 RepID=Q2HU71_MEDTR|nr:hypothetical protein MtrDRAFT_AC149208g29v2 [Medicago truncatula]AES78455.1 transmembrane protein, putative [Medicago truncatula]
MTLGIIIISIIVICFTLWSIIFGFGTVFEPEVQLWITCFGVMILLSILYLLAPWIRDNCMCKRRNTKPSTKVELTEVKVSSSKE